MELNIDSFQIWLGNVGQGKTLSVVEKVVLPALESGIDVYCNFWVNWKGDNYHFFHEFEEIINVRNCIVVFDEIQQVLDPRAWEKEGLEVRRFFQEHRKHHVEIHGTTQHISLIAKSALIIVDSFVICEKLFTGRLFKLIKFPYIVIRETEMTLNEIKMEDKIILFDSSTDDDDTSFSLGESTTHWYPKRRLLHEEHNQDKSEILHYFCPLCQTRQGDPIPYNTDYNKAISTAPFCPKHRDIPLDVKDSGIYDTNYVVKPKIKHHIWKAFVKCSCGRLEPYTGPISDEEMVARSKLETD